MATKKSTHLIIETTAKPSGDMKERLEARAARFQGLMSTNATTTSAKTLASPSTSATNSATTAKISTSTDPALNAKLLARAARFADVKSSVPATKTSATIASTGNTTNLVDAEKLAKRAARFADVPKPT